MYDKHCEPSQACFVVLSNLLLFHLSDLDRTELNKGKSGCMLKGIYAINPVNGKDFAVGDPIYIYSPL